MKIIYSKKLKIKKLGMANVAVRKLKVRIFVWNMVLGRMFGIIYLRFEFGHLDFFFQSLLFQITIKHGLIFYLRFRVILQQFMVSRIFWVRALPLKFAISAYENIFRKCTVKHNARNIKIVSFDNTTLHFFYFFL